MDSVPLEILQKILWQLPKPLALYGTVSQLFQHVIESKTFASIHVSNTDDSLKDFDAAFTDRRRRSLLRTLTLKTGLPFPQTNNMYTSVDYVRSLSTQSLHGHEVAINNTAYTRAIQALFSRLQEWDEASTAGLEQALSLHLVITFEPILAPFNLAATHLRFQSLPIEFVDLQVLPPLSWVKGFTHTEESNHHVHESVISVLSKALPCVETCCWHSVGALCNPGSEDLRTNLRATLASTLQSTSFAHLVSLRIVLLESEPSKIPPDFPIQQFVKPGEKDDLSLALNRVSKLPSLKELFLEGNSILSPQVFGLDDEVNGGNLAWRSLEHLKLSVSNMTPTGGRYFNSAPNTEMFPWQDNVGSPNPATLFPFMTAMARAVVRMPALRNFCCEFPGNAYLFCASAGEPLRDTDWNDVSSGPLGDSLWSHNRWLMDFGPEKLQDDDGGGGGGGGGDPAQFEWELPSKMMAVLKEAEHRVFRPTHPGFVQV
ncbi:hypothetical protein MGN70_007080 [Eutypa lata]|nr:hypothetical protein MGN70_007080 [Eutypa lata]